MSSKKPSRSKKTKSVIADMEGPEFGNLITGGPNAWYNRVAINYYCKR